MNFRACCAEIVRMSPTMPVSDDRRDMAAGSSRRIGSVASVSNHNPFDLIERQLIGIPPVWAALSVLAGITDASMFD